MTKAESMAELLGLVASGISVAQVAASIASASLKLKLLVDEVKDAPESLRELLNHVELLTPILCDTTNEDVAEMAGRVPASPQLTQTLQNALAACQKAAQQLQLLALDLSSQIEAARGGARRRFAMAKVLLKKGTLSKYEMRLEKAVQLLSLAQQTYIVQVYDSPRLNS